MKNQIAIDRQIEALKRSLGLEILGALADKSVVEVMLNPGGWLWVDRQGKGMELVCEIDSIRATSIVQAVAAIHDTVVNADNPILECELPLSGERFEALIPPCVSSPTFTIRKKASIIFTLENYISSGVITQEQFEIIESAVKEHKNILISGGTGTGKTTLANAILHSITQHEPQSRIVVIEDTQELQCESNNAVFLRTSYNTNQIQLLRATMRLRPDRIVVGEVRDGAALALLKAWNTGHPGGVATVHANNAQAALVRIGQLVQEAGVPPQPELIREAVNVVVSIVRTPEGRRVDEVYLPE